MALEKSELNMIEIERKITQSENSTWTQEDEELFILLTERSEKIKNELAEIDEMLRQDEIESAEKKEERKEYFSQKKEQLKKIIRKKTVPLVLAAGISLAPNSSGPKAEKKVNKKEIKVENVIPTKKITNKLEDQKTYTYKKEDKKVSEEELILPEEPKEKENLENKKKKIKPEIEDKNVNPRFNLEVYNSLADQGKDVYKEYAENNPTPGFGYMILDKDSAVQYIFDKENKLISKIKPGFGKDTGDKNNTSKSYNEGDMTTPGGVYLILNPSQSVKEDIDEYGENQFPLYGISVLGDTVNLKMHQTYSKHGEYEKRTKLLKSKDPLKKKFSNGCINVPKEDFKKILMKNFRANGKELLFVLQDKEGRGSGVKFNVKSLLNKMMPILLNTAEGGDEAKNEERLKEMLSWNTEQRDSLSKKIDSLTNNRNNLDSISQNKNKGKKESEISKINNQIEELKKELNKAEKFVAFAERELAYIYGLRKKVLALSK